MDVVVVIPGIEGSALASPDGVEVWPPRLAEVVGGYRRIDQLTRKDLQATHIIRSVCIDVYGSLLSAIEGGGFSSDGAERRLVEYAYDWRRDLLALADELGRTLQGIVQAHGAATRIKLVCHSMGGLLARACLERPRDHAPSWLAAVDLCVFLATPHEGAPLALARAAGLGGASEGISAADFRKLVNAEGFPAGYELFPAQDLLCIWDLSSQGSPLSGHRAFDPSVVQAESLNPHHVEATTTLQDALDERRRPRDCRYFSIVSAYHDTVTRFDRSDGQLSMVSVGASGDGTVPIRSSTALRVQTAFVKANHIGVAQNDTTHQLLAMLLGVTEPGPVVAEVGSAQISVSQSIVTQGQPFEVAIGFDAPGSQEGQLVFRREEGGGLVEVQASPIKIEGASTRKLVLGGPNDLGKGRYQVSFDVDGAPLTATDLVIAANASVRPNGPPR